MKNFIVEFSDDQSGAVTVDWVVLAAAVIFMGIATISLVQTGADTTTTKVMNDVTTMSTKYTTLP